jgi:anthranilate/para-aminobenzoate synthase component II
MRLLLIDNGLAQLGQLQAVCAKYELDIVQAGEISKVNTEDFDAVILAGGFGHTVANDVTAYQAQLDIISSAGKPVLGIGFGFELVCYAIGARLDRIGEFAGGAPVITPTEDGAKVFQGTDPMRVNETERWLVEAEDLPKLLAVLATSETGVEAFKHKSRPVYGLQLFPEDFAYASDGKLVFENILASFQKLGGAVSPLHATATTIPTGHIKPVAVESK